LPAQPILKAAARRDFRTRSSLNHDVTVLDKYLIFAPPSSSYFYSDLRWVSAEQNLAVSAMFDSANPTESVHPAKLTEDPWFVNAQKFRYFVWFARRWFDDFDTIRSDAYANLSRCLGINEAVVNASQPENDCVWRYPLHGSTRRVGFRKFSNR
jgi:hypothetical protein